MYNAEYVIDIKAYNFLDEAEYNYQQHAKRKFYQLDSVSLEMEYQRFLDNITVPTIKFDFSQPVPALVYLVFYDGPYSENIHVVSLWADEVKAEAEATRLNEANKDGGVYYVGEFPLNN